MATKQKVKWRTAKEFAEEPAPEENPRDKRLLDAYTVWRNTCECECSECQRFAIAMRVFRFNE